MKNLKRMTRQQSKQLKEYGVDNAHSLFYVERFTTEKAVLVSKLDNSVKEVIFNG